MIKNFVKRIFYAHKYSSETFINYLRNSGVEIGEDCTFYEPNTNTIDMQNPWMLKIGNNVRITKGGSILTHYYSWSVLSGVYGECLGGVGNVCIGNNVFLGYDSIVLKNVNIGDNVIIGASSVITRNFDSNSVYAGIPAKK